MSSKLTLIAPEILVFAGAVVVAVLGLARSRAIRDAVPWTTIAFLAASVVATLVVYGTESNIENAGLILPGMGAFVKTLVGVTAIGLVLLGIGSVDRKYEDMVRAGRTGFDPLRVIRGEYHAFLLLSVAGTMLICNANDLAWLFLSIELASLPTYVMVAIGKGTRRNNEAAVKYFFLGAMSSATFLYGFALMYGAAGTTSLVGMREAFAEQAAGSGIPMFGLLGMVLAFVGLCFKITAVPMHFYAPDVYQGAPTPVTAFLSFIPKVGGFVAIILLCVTVGWQGHALLDDAGVRVPIEGLPRPVHATLWIIAILTMILGNIGALLQTSIKRLMAYSSISHSGYMLVGVIAGTAMGIDAVLLYLATYAIATVAAFGVLCGLERHGQEVETLDDLSGLWQRHKGMAAILALAGFSMVGLPPLIGFWGKLELVIAGISAHEVPLVVVLMATSAVSSYYYLHLAGLPLIRKPDARSEGVVSGPRVWPRVAAVVFGLAVLFAPLGVRSLMNAAETSVEGSWLEPAPPSASADAPTSQRRS
ncbi:MAG: NADH-quinone oxidoreductase subunit N [Phycisphaerales bacterium]|nr:NADH-quinone oxidoreductase subunit N [Phycisphaerales bacterium]